MKTNYILILAFFIILISPLVSSEIQSLGTFKQNSCVDLVQTCANCTYTVLQDVTYPNSTSACPTCAEVMTENIANKWEYNFCNTDALGKYIVTGYSDVESVDTVWAYDFEVTPNGEAISGGKATFYVSLLAFLLIFFGICLYFFNKTESLNVKVGSFGFGYLLLVAIVFVAWTMANDFFTSIRFVSSFLRVLFITLMVGAFPMLLGGLAYYFIMLFKIKEIERMMNKGMPYSESLRRYEFR